MFTVFLFLFHTGSCTDNSKKDITTIISKNDTGYHRRVTALNNKGGRHEIKIPNLINRLGKFMSESLYLSLYGRMYRDMLINEIKLMEYGEKAAKIMRENTEYSTYLFSNSHNSCIVFCIFSHNFRSFFSIFH